MTPDPEQGELFGLLWEPAQYPFRLRANDLIRISPNSETEIVNQKVRKTQKRERRKP